jgi:hypothetical protein
VALYDQGRDKDRPQHRRDVIPSACVFDVHTPGGRRNVVSGSCVDQLTRIRTLPGACAFDIRTTRGPRTVYGAGCLTGRGYRIEPTRYN